MNTKRTLIIAAVAVLVILTSAAAFQVLPRLATGAQPNLVTANTGANSRWVPGEEYIHPPLFQAAKADGASLMKFPGAEYIHFPPVQANKTDGASLMKSPGAEYIHTPLFQADRTDGASLMKSPGAEYIHFPPAQAADAGDTAK